MTKEDFFNQYEIDISEGRLGGGAFGTVYKAYDNVNSLWKAVKIAEVKFIGGKSFSLISEFNATKNLKPHRNIANYESVYQFQMPNGLFDYAVMQYYAEGNLKDLIRRGGLSLSQKQKIAQGIIFGIHYLHQHAVIHRDLKPSNILISKRRDEYIPKIADFGLSKLVNEAGLSEITNSFGGGTLEYSSPEQLAGNPLRYNSDLWSVGVLIFELLSGKIPFDSDSFVGSDAARRAQIYQNINEVNIQGDIGNFPSPYDEIISRTLVRDPAIRLQDSTEILRILNPAIAEKLVAAQVIDLEVNKEPILDEKTIILDREEISRKLEEEKRLLKLKVLEEHRANELAREKAAKEKERKKEQEDKLKKEEERRRKEQEKAKRKEEVRLQKELKAKRLAEEKQKQRILEGKKLALLKQKEEEANRKNAEEKRIREEEKAKRDEEIRLEKELEANRLAKEKQKQKFLEEKRLLLLKQEEEEERRRTEEEKAKREEEVRLQKELDAKRLAQERQKQKIILLEKKKKQEEQKIKADQVKAERQAQVLKEKTAKRHQRRKERREKWLKFKPTLIKTTKRAALVLLLLVPLFFTARFANSYYKSIPKPYTSGELQGYKNSDGVIVVEAKFDAVAAFKNGQGIAFRGDSTFVFNRDGMLIQSKISESQNLQEGVESQDNIATQEDEDLAQTRLLPNVQPSSEKQEADNTASNNSREEISPEMKESKSKERKGNASDEIASIENKSENIEENEGGDSNNRTNDIPGQGKSSENELESKKDPSFVTRAPIKNERLTTELSAVDKNESDEKKVSLLEKTPIASSYVMAIEQNLVKIKGGAFRMGCEGKSQDCQSDESPSFSTKLGNYYMSKYEVTQKEFREIMAYNPSYNKGCPSCPVENVSYSEVMEYISRLNNLEGNKFKYRLPTEKEWEYAALGGKDYIYAGSNDADAVAEYKTTNGIAAIEVNKTKKNNYGLGGMSGNVSEWCSDWYDKNTYSYDKAPQSGSLKVVRGGSWNDRKRIVRIRNRGRENPDTKKPTIGFRLVRAAI